jgi:TnpA family transposase
MKKHEILLPQARAALFDPPNDPAAIIRHYTLSPDDLALIRRRRRDANRLGFALHLAFLRFPGRVLGIDETPPAEPASIAAPIARTEKILSIERKRSMRPRVRCSTWRKPCWRRRSLERAKMRLLNDLSAGNA